MVARAFERASRYLPMMRKVFQEKALPEELINLAFIESAVNPWATSKAKAAGIWQFMAPTGRLYGMQVSWWVDERRDPKRPPAAPPSTSRICTGCSTPGSSPWPPTTPARARCSGPSIGSAPAISGRCGFPKETQLFVPAFMAMTIISKDPERYGFSPPPDQPFEIDLVTLENLRTSAASRRRRAPLWNAFAS